MIAVVGTSGAAALPLVLAALRRSLPAGLVESLDPDALAEGPPVLVLVDPEAGWAPQLRHWLANGQRKVLLLGRLPDPICELLQIDAVAAAPLDPAGALAAPAVPHAGSSSPLSIRYQEAAATLGARQWQRAFRRYDFADEWNNLGFGAMGLAGDIWSIGAPLRLLKGELAAIVDAEGVRIASYCGLFDTDAASSLWFNRPVGPIDSFEWRLVENFLSRHRPEATPLVPVLSEAPAGHDLVVTMRLDCDEDIESARALHDAYRARGIPLSLAVKTGLITEGFSTALLDDVLASGGSVLAHSVTHAPNWGGSYEAACREAGQSALMLKMATGQYPRYAVSPFHQTPLYALAALSHSGLVGCIGGNIASDPAFNLARGGVPSGSAAGFVGQSQQCMLHGDCLLDGPQPMAIYVEAARLAHQSGSLFGYLDHPFSPRYQYGWADEAERIAAHMTLIDAIAALAEAPLHLSADAALDFSALRSRVRVTREGDIYRVATPQLPASLPPPVLELGGQRVALSPGGVTEVAA